MALLAQILGVTFPFFALVLCGFLAVRAGLLPLDGIPGLNIFVLYLALPCMLFRFAAGTPLVQLIDPGTTLTYLLCALTMLTVTVAATRRGPVGWNDASFGALVAAFPNSGFMGVPLLVALLGQAAAAPAIVALSVDMVVTSSLCIALSRLDGAGTQGARRAAGTALRGMATNPLPWSIVLGGLSSASGVALPAIAMKPVSLLADAASPVALFTLGAVLARSYQGTQAAGNARKLSNDALLVVALKLLLHPLLVFAAVRLAISLGLPLDPLAALVLVLVAALPSASNVPMLAERFGADAGRIAVIVLLTTALAFVTFSLTVAGLVPGSQLRA